MSRVLAGIAAALCAIAAGSPLPPAPAGMVRIPAGRFRMGCGPECPMDDAKPVHAVAMAAFWMDVTPVTNAEFGKFVGQTGYRTVAERTPKAEDYPTVPKDRLLAGSAVFTPADAPLSDPYAWWRFTPGASWRHPDGPRAPDAALHRPSYPVVHVAYEDALAYCTWAGKDLPTEAQFEYAARGGLARKKYAWGDELKPRGRWVANIWQGRFPKEDSGEDGYRGLSPVDAFPKNGYGLHDMGGNVWQWCKDWYRPDTYTRRVKEKGAVRNPAGPADGTERVQRGGSYLCSERYCSRFLVGSRGKGAADNSASNLGFRCVRSAHR